MSVLVDVEIRELSSTQRLIEPFEESSLQGASYDMRLGRQFVRHGAVVTLNEDSPTLVIGSGEFVLLTSMEFLRIPIDMVGHNGIMSNWAKRGLVSLFSPQIDPGFHGILVVPVFNAGDMPISIQLGEKIFTVEFVMALTDASYGWSDRNGEQRGINNLAIPLATRPNLSDIAQLGQKVERLERELIEAKNRLELFEAKAKGELGEDRARIGGEIDVLKEKIATVLHERSHVLSRRNLIITIVGVAVAVLATAVNIFIAVRGPGEKENLGVRPSREISRPTNVVPPKQLPDVSRQMPKSQGEQRKEPK